MNIPDLTWNPADTTFIYAIADGIGGVIVLDHDRFEAARADGSLWIDPDEPIYYADES